jgi:hypothetical protein
MAGPRWNYVDESLGGGISLGLHHLTIGFIHFGDCKRDNGKSEGIIGL